MQNESCPNRALSAPLAAIAGIVFIIGLFLWLPAAIAADEDGIYARLNTNRGVITARLYHDKVPLTVMNFIGLAEGTTNWEHPESGEKGKRPLYKNLKFHNVKGFMVQTGDPLGNGKGGPGFVFDDEFHPGLSHSKPGILSMANRGPNTNGSQFFITTKSAKWLDRRYTLFGEVVSGLELLSKIQIGDELKSIEIVRNGKDAESFDTTRAHLLSGEIKAARKEAAKKNLPEPTNPVDPARVPEAGQKLTSPGDFDFLVIGHTGMKVAGRLGREFYYDHKGAIEIAAKLARLARAKGADFKALIKTYSDMTRDTTSRGVKDSPLAPAGLKAIFRLKPGQISDPVDLPTGVYIFRRLQPGAKTGG